MTYMVWHQTLYRRRRFDSVSGTDKRGNPVHDLPNEVLDSIRRNRTLNVLLSVRKHR